MGFFSTILFGDKKMKPMSIRLPDDKHDRLKTLAAQRGIIG